MLTPREQLILGLALSVILAGCLWMVYRESRESWSDWEEVAEEVEAGTAEDYAPETKLAIHVTGEVKQADVYYLSAGDRVIDAIEAAGGFTEKADPEAMNLAAPVSDGQRIWVPGVSSEDDDDDGGQAGSSRVNINRASLQELQVIPGIGPALARRIVDYRNQRGVFTSPEDLLEVSGIGEKTLTRMLPHIRLD